MNSLNPEEFERHPDCQTYWGTIKAIKEAKEALRKMGDEETLAEDIFQTQ